ncbi:hypothetical protein [Sphingosinicella terrae]|uniref:hypothetical protein n=1 Tax=Sphingosinicella terrae TaxID=2172047 RepID=UPI0013B3CAF7|nr:hypothetical protein [Sphingosinicella terrae]
MIQLYRAGAQLTKVRGLMLFSLVCALGTAWWGWDLFRTYGSLPGDGGVLAPLGTRLAVGIGVASIGILFALGMAAYGRIYVSVLALDEPSGTLRASTVRFVGSRALIVPLTDVFGSNYRAGRFVNPAGVSVNAPWISVRVKGRRWPLIVDAQGEFTDRSLVARVLKFR